MTPAREPLIDALAYYEGRMVRHGQAMATESLQRAEQIFGRHAATPFGP